MSKIGFIFHKMLKKIAKAEHHLDFIKRSVLNLWIPKGFILNFSPSAMSFGDVRTTPLNQVCMESSFKIMIATYKQTGIQEQEHISHQLQTNQDRTS